MEELDDWTQFEDLQPEWNSMLSKSRNQDVFSTWEWLSCWWKHFGDGRRLRVLTVQDQGEIIAIAPLMLSKYKFLSLGSLRKIEFIGSPQSDYNNFILLKNETECLRIFFEHLIEDCSDWNYLQLADIHENNLIQEFLHIKYRDAPDALGCTVTNLCPYINLPNSTEAFMENLSQNMRRNLNKRMRRLQREYNVEIKTHKDFKSEEEAMDLFFKLHTKRWIYQGEPGAFVERKIRKFHRDIAKIFSKKGWLSLYFLVIDDQPVSAVYSFDHHKKKYGYLTGFDPEFAKYSPGNLLKMRVVEDCIQRGLREYDLGRDYEPYKKNWTETSRRNFEVTMVGKGLFSRTYSFMTKNDSILRLTQRLGLRINPVG